MVRAAKVVVVEVEGAGEFPHDMLRYDQCAPITQDDVSKMVHGRSRRVVKLNCYDGPPTVARWNSYMWKCTVV